MVSLPAATGIPDHAFPPAARLPALLRCRRPPPELRAAAEELRVTAAAVSHRVRMLEIHLRAPLFDRFYRGVRLNRRGRRYHADIERILGDLHQATDRRRS